MKPRYIVSTLLLLLGVSAYAHPPYKGQGELDIFTFFIKSGAIKERIGVGMDNSMSAGCNYAQGDAVKNLGSGAFNAYIVADDNGDELFMKYKPYSNFYVDFRLELVVRTVATEPYTVTLGVITRQDAMKVVQFIDKEKPESEWVNILTADYSFTLPAARGKYSDRFVLRVYGADIPKLSSAPLDWNSPSSWQSGKLPQSDSHVHILQGSSVKTRPADNINIEILSTLGYLENNGRLNVKDVEFY